MEKCKRNTLHTLLYHTDPLRTFKYSNDDRIFIEISGSWAIQHNINIFKQTPFEIDKNPFLSISLILQVYPLLKELRNFQPESTA